MIERAGDGTEVFEEAIPTQELGTAWKQRLRGREQTSKDRGKGIRTSGHSEKFLTRGAGQLNRGGWQQTKINLEGSLI